MAINHITVDFPLLFLVPHNHLSTHHLALAHALDAAKPVRQPGDEPLPSTEGCGLDQDLPGPQLPQKRGRNRRPSPFQRDVGGLDSLNGWGGGGVELRNTGHDICRGSFS